MAHIIFIQIDSKNLMLETAKHQTGITQLSAFQL